MKRYHKDIAGALCLVSFCAWGRNPFEFSDHELQKYTMNKVQQKEKAFQQEKKSQRSAWEIVEVKNDNTHIIKDDQGNVRSITLSPEK